MAQTRVIRKYANRRLYDATASKHVTLEDIRRLIAAGEQVQVIDDRSGADLTRPVLLQIIADQEQFGQPVLSIPLLEGIIRFYGNPVQEMLTRYLEQSMGNVLRQQQTVQTEMAKALEAPFAPLADLTRQNMEMWTRMQAALLAAMAPPVPTAPAAAQAAEEPRGPDRPRASDKSE